MRRRPAGILLSRSVVEGVAKIIGPQSAAAKALEEADRLGAAGYSSHFWSVGDHLLVITAGCHLEKVAP